jgi:hypothetical protein
MRCLIVIILYALLAGPTSLSAQGVPGSKSQNIPELAIVGKSDVSKSKKESQTGEGGKSKEESKPKEGSKPEEKSQRKEGNELQEDSKAKPEDFRFKLGESLQIRATGSVVEQIKTEWKKTKALALYFDGVRIADLKSPPQQVEVGELWLNFNLHRDANDDNNRKAWDTLFKKKDAYEMTIEQPALGIGSDLPLVVDSAKPLQFYVATATSINLTLLVCLAILGVAYWYVAKRTPMLRDADTGYYSLGKSQMAFWGFLVLLSFAGVWFLTGTMERIPPQALILLGISGATGLSAVVIGNSKKAETKTQLAGKKTKLTELRQEEQKLQEQQASSPTTFSQASQDRMAAVKREIDAISKEIDELFKQLSPGESKGFWQDICDDGNGASFHRLQVVIWTMVLGAVFIQTVAQVMSMPEFPQTLLTLLGISNATYLGFKIPE